VAAQDAAELAALPKDEAVEASERADVVRRTQVDINLPSFSHNLSY
jgi:hypothetical protein